MKIRTDFVSNSSSSSFIVIVNSGPKSEHISSFIPNQIVTFPSPDIGGETAFGWEETTYRTFEDKLNFIGLQLLYLAKIRHNIIYNRGLGKKTIYSPYGIDENTFQKYYEMTKKVCKEKFNLNVGLADVLCFSPAYDYVTMNNYNMYIDHQSSASEGQCLEMFKDEESLYNFLEFDGSYIQGGNDNN